MSEMVERAARALCRAMCEDEEGWQYMQGEARAVLQALREPTEAMVEEGNTVRTSAYASENTRATWDVMIAAALGDQAA